MYDLVIKKGSIIDGSGKKSFVGDIGITAGMIRDIADDLQANGKKEINAEGYVVCPGFIDIHSHSDFTLLINPRAESKIRQGITTELVGNCGFTAAPVNRAYFTELMHYLVNTVILDQDEKKEWNWPTQRDFIGKIEEKGTAINIASLVGHGTLRVAVMGLAKREASRIELNTMRKMLEKEMQSGIIGLSTGLEYIPGSYATWNELVELTEVVAKYNGIYTTHLKSEGDYLIKCISEAIEIADKSKVSLEISHLKAAGSLNWGKVSDAVKMIEQARQNGVKVDFDLYPYLAFGSGLLDLLPPWARENLAILQDKELRKKVLNEMKNGKEGWENPMLGANWNMVKIAALKTTKNKRYEGLAIKQIAEKMGCSPEQAVLKLLAEEQGAVKMIFWAMCEQDLNFLIKHPLAMFCTDGRAVAPYGKLAAGKIHPRYYGSYPRLLGYYVREKGLLTLEEAIRKMTSLPARKLNLKDRGLVKHGYQADLTIFKEEEVIDLASYQDPHQYPRGIEYVLVNGEVVIAEGEHTGKLPGKVLSPT